MHWFKLLLIPINLLVIQSEACKQKTIQAASNKTEMIEEKTDVNLLATWVESGIDENGMIYKLPPRRGGISNLTFKSDGTIIDKGPVNCGFGRQYEGVFVMEGKSIIANYDKTTKYMGQNKDPESVEVIQKFDIEKVSPTELILIRYNDGGDERKMGFLKKEIWDNLESNEYPKNIEKK